MKRIHAFEFEDLSWFPKNLRNYGTDFLQFGANTFDIYKDIVPILEKGLKSAGNNTILDIASGGGGSYIKLANHLKAKENNIKIILTDYYPNIPAFERTQKFHPEVISFEEKSVDAMNVSKDLKGFRTQFLSLHHFNPKDAKKILQDAVNNKQPIGIFEAQQRDIKSLIPMILSPISVLLMTPFIRPFKFDRILFTYLIPIIPLFVMWDGIVSVLRTHTNEELKSMVASLEGSDSFEWEIATTNSKPSNISYLLGTPKKA
jgi:ubiquinone/menaquinone biosynthesis C-methylase UbiE